MSYSLTDIRRLLTNPCFVRRIFPLREEMHRHYGERNFIRLRGTVIRVGVRRGIVQVGNEQTGIRVSIVADLQNVPRIHVAIFARTVPFIFHIILRLLH